MRTLNKSSKKLNERRRINEFWRKKLSKIETSSSKILFQNSRKNSLYDEMKNLSSKIDSIKINNVLKIYFIAAVSFNILSRQKDVKIFVVFMKDLDIQLKKQESKKIVNLKSVMSTEYHDFLNIFSK